MIHVQEAGLFVRRHLCLVHSFKHHVMWVEMQTTRLFVTRDSRTCFAGPNHRRPTLHKEKKKRKTVPSRSSEKRTTQVVRIVWFLSAALCVVEMLNRGSGGDTYPRRTDTQTNIHSIPLRYSCLLNSTSCPVARPVFGLLSSPDSSSSSSW